MVLPLNWYQNAFTIIDSTRPSHISVHHDFQTNATLLTDEWCTFLKRKDVTLGVSIDGPREIHDHHRRTRNGLATFDKVMSGVARLHAHRVDFEVISVLTAISLKYPREMFAFYDTLDVHNINFNFEEIEGVNTSSSLCAPGQLDAYKTFLRTFWRHIRENEKDWTIREITRIVGRLAHHPLALLQDALFRPGMILSFDSYGNVGTFSPELITLKHPAYGDFSIGNINTQDLESILNGSKVARISAEIAQGVALCRKTCTYFDVCGGGMPSNKLCENGTFVSTETMNCKFRIKATTDVVLDIVQTSLNAVKPKRRQCESQGVEDSHGY